MGGSLSRVFGRLFRKKEVRILMVGLDGAGKTTILCRLKLGKTVPTIPTVGFNVQTVQYKNIKFNVWDVGGQEKIRPLWRHYYTGTHALIFVVDTNDVERLDEARQELHMIVSDREMKDAVILVFANKMDLPHAVGRDELVSRLQMDKLNGRVSFVQQSCATNGEGLFEGLNWLSENVEIDGRKLRK